MNQSQLSTELKKYIRRIRSISKHFQPSGMGLLKLLPEDKQSELKEIIIELSIFCNEIFGEENIYSKNIKNTLATKSRPILGPTDGCVTDIVGILNAALNNLQRGPIQNAKNEISFVSPDRIYELEAIQSTMWDLTKLKEYCRELNICFENKCYLAIAMILRAIIDHVPPIFGCTTFAEVSNNYGGGKSFKKSMSHLHNSLRNVADSHLHVQIRKTESLPTSSQVNFTADLDMLLAEISRILK